MANAKLQQKIPKKNKSKSGGGNRKIGNKKAQPAMHRYTATQRWLANKEKKQKRHAKRAQKHAQKLLRRLSDPAFQALQLLKRVEALLAKEEAEKKAKQQAAAEQRTEWLKEVKRRAGLGVDLRTSYKAAGYIKPNPALGEVLQNRQKSDEVNKAWENYRHAIHDFNTHTA